MAKLLSDKLRSVQRHGVKSHCELLLCTWRLAQVLFEPYRMANSR